MLLFLANSIGSRSFIDRPTAIVAHLMRCATMLLGLIGVGMLLSSASAQSPPSVANEQKVKVAYLYNFSRYFSWPESTFDDNSEPFVIGVLGDDTLGSLLDRLTRKKFNKQRPIVVRRFKTWHDYQPCQLLFVTGANYESWEPEFAEKLAAEPMLIVTESNRSSTPGAIVGFYPDVDGTIGFEIDIDAAKRRQLGVDAKLLQLARIVRSEGQK